MTNKLFWDDPYQTSAVSKVSSVNDNIITVEDTIFYAMSGGQESDSGSFNGIEVLEAKKQNDDILYTFQKGHNFKVGDSVEIKIDWERRYKLMRLHFSAEVVLEIINKILKVPIKIGANISPIKARIDFELPESISGLLPQVNSEAKKIFDANSEIISDFSDESKTRRYWEVKGFSKVACGGTHLKRTGEVGEIQLKRKNIGKGKERVEISLKTPVM